MTQREILTQRYLDNTITTGELEELTKLLAEEGITDEDQLFREIEIDLRTRQNITQEDRDHVAKELFFERDEKGAVPMYRSSRFVWKAAAVIVFVLGIGLYTRIFKNSDTASISSREKITPVIRVSAKEPKFVVFPDKSTAILNAGSELSYSKTYGQETREVFLKGEAFFDIQHDPAHKFIVRSGDITTTVLGTAFNVKALPSQKEVIVAVTRGKVAVKDDRQEFGTITPNEQFTVNIENHVCVRSKVKEENAAGWTNEFIIIDNQTFERAVEIIEARFNVKITVENEALNNCRITSAFLEKPKLEDVLTVISTLAKATYTVKEKNVIIHGGEVCKE